MKKVWVFLFTAMAGSNLMAKTLHVDLSCTNSIAPYATRETAATNIQTAVNASATGDTVKVWDGHYLLASEITVTVSNAITIRSVNGPDTTIVDGQGSVRCFNLGNYACVIEGLTITNGYSSADGGGIFCSGTTPVVTHCIISGNSAGGSGGGMFRGTANNCTLSGNSSDSGGGMGSGTANHCTLSGNSASRSGGGMYYGTANNCRITGNTASSYGGGMYQGTAYNCTLSGNSASRSGGGMYYGTANNCIVWHNTAPSGKDLWDTTARYSCSPDVTHGVNGNITTPPMLASSSHIAADSPCRGAGSADYASGTDIDGESWANPPSMGCDEPSDGLPGGPIAVDFLANESMVASGYPIRFWEQIHGSLSAHVWDFGDGSRVTNSPSVEHAWASAGTFEVVLTAYNADWPGGVSATQEVSIVSFEETAIHVSQNGNDANDGTSWASAKKTIQAGVDAQDVPGGGVLVGSGTYSLSATITVSKRVYIVGLDGPENTIVDGQGSVRCFNLGNYACVVEGLTITNGYYSGSGGGIYCSGIIPVVTNCTISGNTANSGGGMYYGTANNCILNGNSASGSGGGMYYGTANNCILNGNSASGSGGGMGGGTANHCTISGNSSDYGGGMGSGTAYHCTITGNSANSGGGMYNGTANNCTLSGNTASSSGGGMYSCTANNCILSGNSASRSGGGMYYGTANNCIVWHNTAPSGKDLWDTTARYSCSPDVTHGVNGNITTPPMLASSSHIAADSPCRGAGSADYASGTDIDGESWANPPSMGCDEPSDGLPSGPIAVDFFANESMVASGYPIRFWEQIHGSLSAHVWDFGDGSRVTNSPSVEHVWATAGTFDVVLTAYNADWPGGVSATQEVSIVSFEETAIHVSQNGNDANDGTSWASAKKTIQAGVDAQDVLGGGVLVGSGTYSLSATITVSKRVYIVGLDGPENTIVDGQGSVRCFTLGNYACVVEGLTITNGYYSGSGGGIYCTGNGPAVTNCTITGNSANSGGGMYYGTANNCTISGNSANSGGGMYFGTANNCILNGNSASGSGGGMVGGTANHCTISGNSSDYGGGMCQGTANNCTLSGNSAENGGGMYYGTANNCILNGNSAIGSGGGMHNGTANNCTISGNSATQYGGGMYYGTANNCTITGNSASGSGGGMYEGRANNCILSGNSAQYGGGMYEGTAYNCIVWYNTAPSGKDLWDTTARYSCSSDVTHGVDGNITNVPILLSSSHIAADSPCRSAGSANYATGTDIDGEAWANPPSMGCDEPSGGLPRGPIAVDFVADELMVASGFPIRFLEQIHGSLSAHVWDFGDGTRVTNSPSVEHAWATAGTFDVVLTAYNADRPGGVSSTQEVSIVSFEETAIHVSPNGNDANDGTSWASAKKTIQAGFDAQGFIGGGVLVGSGTYSLSATITVSKRVDIVGVDGPESTKVDGQGSVCCFNLGNTACVIEGLTITNGYSSGNGGGIYCSGIIPVVTNCILSGNTASYYGGGMVGGTANNCTLSGNSSDYGGGMVGGTANHCTIIGNSAIDGGGMVGGTANHCTISGNTAVGSYSSGGGMYNGTANNCILSGNSAEYGGGGMVGGTANNCTISGNTAQSGGGMGDGTANNCTISGNSSDSGGGMYQGTANNCILSGNSAEYDGGGMGGGTANNCIINGNTAAYSGGGMWYGTANNCTISGNSATQYGGGMYEGTANNCIVWYNTAPSGNDLSDATARYSCSPDVTHGVDGNITNAPMLASSSHIAADSPCRGAGSADYATGTDIDGEAWANPPSMGCDEPYDTTDGDISVSFTPSENKVLPGEMIAFKGIVEGAALMHVWDFGDGTQITNSLSVDHVWATSDTYDVVLTAYNADWPNGVSSTQEVWIATIEDFSIYVSPDGNDANDGTSWTNAKKSIQAGVDAQELLDGWVLVGSGTYPLSSTIRVSKPVYIKGVDGPESTIVDGQGKVRCFNLGNTACVIEGLTITNGYTTADGGGIYCSGMVPVVTNCILSGNLASSSGGGMYYGTANNCTLSGNSSDYGGGMVGGTANNCTIIGNTAEYGGGMNDCTANNCILSGNAADFDGGGMVGGTANHCILSGNRATYGGGILLGAANHCILSGNTATYGGGMWYGTANNCTISGNSATQYGGGMLNGTAYNCIVWYNTATSGKDLYSTTARYSCSPDVTQGSNGNIMTAPRFVDAANGDYRLAAGSPCINLGHNGYVVGSLDLAGMPRIVNGIVDMGAYEYYNEDDDEDGDGLPNWWEAVHFGSILGSAPTDDFDNDLLDNWSEWIAGTDPSDPNSVFTASVSTNHVSDMGFVVEWLSVENRSYSVRWGKSLTNGYQVLQNGITYPQNSYTDTLHNAESTGFYQIEVQLK